jgi:hypothetical protein
VDYAFNQVIAQFVVGQNMPDGPASCYLRRLRRRGDDSGILTTAFTSMFRR